MSRIVDIIVADVFNWHCEKAHNADYEVCPNLICRIAYLIERLFWNPLEDK